MAISNVRFYKLEVLPNFDVSKQGIFVHVTKPMLKEIWTLSDGSTKFDPSTLYMTPEKKVGESVERINLVQWLSTRHIERIESGLWFGGENGWELLSNETNSAAINAAIETKIATLTAGPYAQAEITTATNSSTLTIKGIKEADGKIGIPVDTENRDLNIKIDGVYNETDNKIATQSTVTTAVTTAINGLNVDTIQAVTKTTSGNNTTLTFKGVKEVNGKIAQGTGADTFIVGDAKLKIQIGSATIDNVFSANAQSDGTIQLDGNVFKKDENNVISVITKNNDVSSTNPLVTQNDINGLASAMHYRGGVTSLPTADNSTKKGDVWIVTTAFDVYEVGDMFIARADGASATFDTVQGNLTLGIGDGQIAANVGALTNGNLVVGVNDPETGKKGIKTVEFDVTNLTDTTEKNKRTLTYGNGTADTTNGITLYHSATITDTFKVIGKDFTKSINISSANRSIEIARNAGENDSTGILVDLVWNTSIE